VIHFTACKRWPLSQRIQLRMPASQRRSRQSKKMGFYRDFGTGLIPFLYVLPAWR